MLTKIYRRIRYIPLDSPYSTSHFKAHPLSRFHLAKRGERLEAGHGVIAIRTKAVRRLRLSQPDQASGLTSPRVTQPNTDLGTPVVLVDGEPAATGFGRGRIVVPAGPHLVQVQAKASGRYTLVNVPDQGRIVLTSLSSAPIHSRVSRDRLGWFYRSFALGRQAYLERHRTLVWPSLAALATYVFAMLALARTGTEAVVGEIFAPLGIILCAAAGLAAGTLVVLAGVVKSAWNNRRPPKSVHYPPTDLDGGGSWRIVGVDDTSPPRTHPELATLRVHVAFEHNYVDATRRTDLPVKAAKRPTRADDADPQVARSDRYDQDARVGDIVGEELEHFGKSMRDIGQRTRDELASIPWRDSWRSDMHHHFGTYAADQGQNEIRPWIPAPQVNLEERALPAIWGYNEYLINPGERLIEVAVPAPPPELLTDIEVELHGESRLLMEVDCRAGFVTTIEAFATIAMEWSQDGKSLSRYTGRMSSLSSYQKGATQ
ncbi:hypothetical protein [Natronoglycomyces albus]|uniref:Uncharacterized protein n=1 Tax=Natronoglycomyces albus TaxID=2811108 RepID=A0A895XIL0_9ACTN|nr:hypothetical protein [Natronoglycomyces albus]QSB05174.1 hypothetical protein JQS30_15680 [Natronoglycomyces albus]